MATKGNVVIAKTAQPQVNYWKGKLPISLSLMGLGFEMHLITAGPNYMIQLKKNP